MISYEAIRNNVKNFFIRIISFRKIKYNKLCSKRYISFISGILIHRMSMLPSVTENSLLLFSRNSRTVNVNTHWLIKCFFR